MILWNISNNNTSSLVHTCEASATLPVHTREIVKQAQAQEQEKGKISFSLFLFLRLLLRSLHVWTRL